MKNCLFNLPLVALFLLASPLTSPSALTQQPAPGFSPAEESAAANVTAATIRAVTEKLVSKEMQGRGTAQPGALRAANYIADRLKQLGLKPGGDSGSYFQKINFMVEQALPQSSLKVGDQTFQFKRDFVVAPPLPPKTTEVSGDVVFAGFGVISTELNRDDLAGLDLKGKIVFLLGGKPANIPMATWQKYAQRQAILARLAEKGAAAVITSQIPGANQSFSLMAMYLSRRRVSLVENIPFVSNPPFPVTLPTLLVSDAAAETFFAGTDSTFEQIRKKAEAGEIVSRNMNKRARLSISMKNEERPCNNVIGVFPGSDPKLKDEALVYTAHYDAYGIDADGTIYPGAGDNAIGVGKLIGIAEAFAKTKSRRTVIFIALTGEEYGMLGAEHWVHHPTWPIEKVAANINFDGIGSEAWGPLGYLVGVGLSHSDLDDIYKSVAAAAKVTVLADPAPEEGFFYRSDHYAFFKRGIPGLYLIGAQQGNPFELMKTVNQWMAADYHQTTDTIRPNWNWDGARSLSVIGFVIGTRIANQDAMPNWVASSPFNRPRGTTLPPPPRR
ncbi:MAG: M28 family peptidase [Acidobacteria bacterium]|nr:M28 family peptidase [Acidobacteriota bacterium]